VATAAASEALPAQRLAGEISEHVERATQTLLSPSAAACSVVEFEALAVPATWAEVWPDGSGKESTRAVTAPIWNAPIQAALAKHGAVFFPKRDQPYYINSPIVLTSGQRIGADPEAEIRLVPNTNTCMVRNQHLVSGQDRPIPADAVPDTDLTSQACSEMWADSRAESGDRTTTHLKNNREHSAE
jgi:hypothetical protein